MIENLRKKVNFQKNKKIILASVICVVVLSLGLSYCSSSSSIKNTAKEDMILTVPPMGGLRDLNEAMEKNSRLRSRVKQILDVDAPALFSNYKTIDNVITEVLLLWIGLDIHAMKKIGRQKSVEVFIRNYYGLPKDEPIKNNPMLGKRPWYDLFQNLKAKILMQGHGHEIFDGVAYYDSNKDTMVVEGGLSFSYLDGLAQFIKTQPKDKQRGYINSYLFFVDNTLQLKH